MRPGQQNKRGRGRGTNNNNNTNNNGGGNGGNFNRKGSNPLTRTYDSSGPDVKIRGTAQHVAEKYMTLARDSQSAGDRVMAENYLQHAEHYNRIIASAQAQMQERFQREERNDFSDRDNDDQDGGDNDEQQFSQPVHQVDAPAPAPVEIAGSGPQPVIEGTPAEVAIDADVPADGAPAERAPARRRGAAGRPRRQPRRNAEEASGDDAPATDGEAPSPALADVTE